MIGATPEGKKELLGFQVGVRESAQSWRELLIDLKARGLTIAPELAVDDGALGFWKAFDGTGVLGAILLLEGIEGMLCRLEVRCHPDLPQVLLDRGLDGLRHLVENFAGLRV